MEAGKGPQCNHTNAHFTHGLCPDCAKKLYPEVFEGKVSIHRLCDSGCLKEPHSRYIGKMPVKSEYLEFVLNGDGGDENIG